MTLYHRYRRWRGDDTTETLERSFEVYEYTVTHLNGEVTTDVANEHRYDEGFLELIEVPRVAYIDIGGGKITPPWSYSSWDTIRRLEGIQEVEREQIGVDEWELVRDKADGTVISTDHERVVDRDLRW